MANRPDLNDAELLAIDVASLFVLAESGRILHENEPGRPRGPRMYLAGCESGNIVRIRHDVGVDTERAIQAFVADEPPLVDHDSDPVFRDEYRRLLESEVPVKHQEAGLIYYIPQQFRYDHDEAVISSGSPEGDRLISGMEAGMPETLIEVGFTEPAHLWEPWSVAMFEGEIASICMSARLGENGAEAGVTTIPSLRGRGFGAAATSAWATHPALRDHKLFYSTKRQNVSSQRVAARLGLRPFGASLRLY